MGNQIKTVYVIHHSHTDIGYTDLQERVIVNQVNYIETALELMKKEENKNFRWNCETLFCVEEFFKTASEEQKQQFFSLAKENKLGLSANYLNFNDLLDAPVCKQRIGEWSKYFAENGVDMRTAMFVDINGISMGCRDAMIDNGVEFLYANIHCHHGMYPLFQNQNAFFWENKAGKRLLVWNGEHYNIGNALGIKPNRAIYYMHGTYFGQTSLPTDPVENLHNTMTAYIDSCESQGYPYDFIPVSVSGVFSDNAPPETEILHTIEGFNELYGDEVTIRMVSLQELYAEIKDKLTDVPVYHGDLTDWWANGVGTTPYAVKHYREAQQRYYLCKRLDPKMEEHYPALARMAQDNMLLYAEHTWGHSSTISNPYDTMVLNMDARNNSYASKAHEAASTMLAKISKGLGDTLRYYSTNGKIKVCNRSNLDGKAKVEYYIENGQLEAVEIRNENGQLIPSQISPHPRGKLISFVDDFKANTDKYYTFTEIHPKRQGFNSRQCYVGAESIKDIINNYDPDTYKLPYAYENPFFKLCYRPHVGITSFIDKRTSTEMLGKGEVPFFTPIHEVTEAITGDERRQLGRNIRGTHAIRSVGHLDEVVLEQRGPVFTQLRFRFTLPGTIHSDVIVKFYEEIPRVDFWLEIGKTLSTDIESIFLPLSLNVNNSQTWIKKGTEAFRPGIDQLPGTCMEYYMSDNGISYTAPEGSVMISTQDVPLLYMGEMIHHPIQLCDNKPENNQRPVYSWVMNNTWETNFKMDLSGFCQYGYTLWLEEGLSAEKLEKDPDLSVLPLEEHAFDPYVIIIE